jgi:proteasome lid subunit RPN8/RPN11
MPETMEIPGRILDAILSHARAELPNECCGLLIGSGLTIEDLLPARNLEASPTSYVIDPIDHFAAIKTARASGRRVVGAYHSHPATPAVPSARDLAEASVPDFVYLIVSLAETNSDDSVRAYRLAEGRATPLTIVVSTRIGLHR